MLTYRLLLWLGDGQWTIRLGAALSGAAITVLLGLIGWLVRGPTVGVSAAAIYAVAGLAPHIEGFTFNGELAASLPATAAVAAVLWWRHRRATWWLLVSGVLAGQALAMKQSGMDGILVGVVVVAVSPPRRLRAVVVFLSAVAVPIGASLLHGAVTGWRRYWQALIGYQLDATGEHQAGLHSRWEAFLGNGPRVGADLALLTLAAMAGLWTLRRHRDALPVAAAWLAATLVGVNLGGSYWPHYYVQALPPLVLGSAAAVAALPAVAWRSVAVVIVVVPTLVWLAALIPASPKQRENAVPYYHRALRDERIAAEIAQLTRPSDRIFIILSEANVYWLAQRPSAYPYVWGMPIEKIPSAVPQLQALVAGPDRPALIGVQSSPDDVDRSGMLGTLIADHYRPMRVVEGMTLHVLRG
jgi:4-amino-4-deoxy-L-arabinose transferase-like glycosyltransferase